MPDFQKKIRPRVSAREGQDPASQSQIGSEVRVSSCFSKFLYRVISGIRGGDISRELSHRTDIWHASRHVLLLLQVGKDAMHRPMNSADPTRSTGTPSIVVIF